MSTYEKQSDTLITSSSFTHRATLRVSNCPTRSPHHDFISFLAVAQRFGIDFLPLTWQPDLDLLGIGGTAEILQLPVNLQMGLAFKRKTPSTTSADSQYRTLISEVSILSKSAIRNHTNIITLEGICWDISVEEATVRPVLVFEKTEYGDMDRFLKSDAGKRMCLNERLKLCADVATALMTIHSCHVIHGDIKPQNVLIFKENSGSYTAKVADFGYSYQYASDDDLVELPVSRPWNAPEWHHRAFKPLDAIKMDVYSFGMLCLWCLFQDNEGYPGRTSIEELKSNDTLRVLAQELIVVMTGLCDKQKRDLDRLFNLTLVRDPQGRAAKFTQLLPLLVRDVITFPPLVRPIGDFFPSHAHFQISPSIRQLYMTDILVRSYIYVCLRAKALRSPGAAYCDECSQKAAFELALCYKIGFGVRKNDVESQIMLDLSKRRRGELEHEMFKLKHLRHEVLKSAFRSDTYKEWILQGHIPTTDFAQRDHDQSDGIEPEYRREITDMESSLGDTCVLVNALRSTLSKILMHRGLWKRSEELLIQVLKIRKTILGVSHPHTMTSSANLAFVYRKQGRWKEAEDLFAEILEISLSAVGPQHPDTLQSMELLALTFSDQGRWEEAEKLYLQALRVRQEQLGVEHRNTLNCMRHSASTFLNQGRWEEAEKLYLQVLRITQKLGAERPGTLLDMTSLAKVFVKQERWEEAAKMYLQVIDTSTKVLGTEHPSYAKLYNALSRAMRHFTNLASGYNPPSAGTVVVLPEKHPKG